MRFFGDVKRGKAITTLVPVDEARALVPTFDVEASPATFGASRVYVDHVDQVPALAGLIWRSLELCGSKGAEGPAGAAA